MNTPTYFEHVNKPQSKQEIEENEFKSLPSYFLEDFQIER